MEAAKGAAHQRTIRKNVQRLQMRIAKAAREGRWGKANALQWSQQRARRPIGPLWNDRFAGPDGPQLGGLDRRVLAVAST